MATLKLAVLVSGRGSNLVAIMDAIDSGQLDAEVVLVMSDKRSAPALEAARTRGITSLFVPKEDRYGQMRDLIDEAGADLIVLAGYMRILPGWFVDRYFGRMINIHPSLLPSFPGLHAQKQALDYGVKVSGCTVHFVDHGCDTGPIIRQVAVPVHDDDDEETLSARILREEHKILPKVISLINDGQITLVDGRTTKHTSGGRD